MVRKWLEKVVTSPQRGLGPDFVVCEGYFKANRIFEIYKILHICKGTLAPPSILFKLSHPS